jgi:hypothetical protein
MTDYYDLRSFIEMTGPTSPDFTVGASSHAEDAWQVFAGTLTGWTGDLPGGDWLTVTLAQPRRIWKLSLTPGLAATEAAALDLCPASVWVYGSNDAISYDLIERFDELSGYVYNTPRDLILSAPPEQAYQIYKLVLGLNTAGGTTKTIGRLGLFQFVDQSLDQPRIRLSPKLPDDVVNLGYAVAPEILPADLGLVLGPDYAEDAWELNLTSAVTSVTDSFLIDPTGSPDFPLSYLLSNELYIADSETVTARYLDRTWHLARTANYVIAGGALIVSGLPSQAAGLPDRFFLDVTYRVTATDLTANKDQPLPSGDLVLTHEYAVPSDSSRKPNALYYCFDLSYPVAKPSQYIAYPAGKSKYGLTKLISLARPEGDQILPLNNPVAFMDGQGEPLPGEFKICLVRVTANTYAVRVYCNWSPADQVWCHYADQARVFRRELAEIRPVLAAVTKTDLIHHIQLDLPGLQEYAIEESHGEYQIHAPIICQELGDGQRQPTEVRVQVHGEINVPINSASPATVRIGVASMNELSTAKYGDAPAVLQSYLPDWCSLVNPHIIDSTRPWLMSLGLPDDYLFDYDIIILPVWGVSSLADYNAALTRYLNQGGTLLVSVNSDISFGDLDPLLDYDQAHLAWLSGYVQIAAAGEWLCNYHTLTSSDIARLGIESIQTGTFVGNAITKKTVYNPLSIRLWVGNTVLVEGVDYTCSISSVAPIGATQIDLIGETYIGTTISYEFIGLSLPEMVMRTTGLQTMLSATSASTDLDVPVLSVKDFAGGGKLYFSAAALIRNLLYNNLSADIAGKLLANLVLTNHTHKRVSTPWLKYNVYHDSELYPEELAYYNYQRLSDPAGASALPVAARRLAPAIGDLVARYCGIDHSAGDYTVTIQEKNSRGVFAEPVNARLVTDAYSYHTPLDLYTIQPLSAPATEQDTIHGQDLTFPSVTLDVVIIPYLYQHSSPTDLDYLSRKTAPVSSRARIAISCAEQDQDQDLFQLVTKLPALPGGLDWADTSRVYYEIALDSNGDQSGEYVLDLDNRVTLLARDRSTGQYLYNDNGSIMISHDWLYSARANHRVYDDIILCARTDYHSLVLTDRAYSARSLPGQPELVRLPALLTNECWFPSVRRLSHSLQDDLFTYRYHTPEYAAQVWPYGLGIRQNSQESAVYVTDRLVRLAHCPLQLSAGSYAETLTPAGSGIYRARNASWDLAAGLVLAVDGVVQGAPDYFAEPVLGYIVFRSGHLPAAGTAVTLAYQTRSYHLVRPTYSEWVRDCAELALVNSRVLVLADYLSRQILSQPTPKVEKLVAGEWVLISPNNYDLDPRSGLVVFKADVSGRYRLNHAYVPVDELLVESVNAANGLVQLGEPVHFTDTILASYQSLEYGYEYQGYQGSQGFELLDLNPSFGHTCLVDGQRVDTLSLLGREVFIYTLPYQVFDRSSKSLVRRGYMSGATNTRTIRHTWNKHEYDLLASQYPELRLLARIKLTNSKTMYDTMVLDTRTRGGGLHESITTDQLQTLDKNLLNSWDISPYAGVGYNPNGLAIIRLPDSIRQRFTADQVEAVCREHLAAGVSLRLAYYDAGLVPVTVSVDEIGDLTLDGILPDGSYPETIALLDSVGDLVLESLEDLLILAPAEED